jgi:hypothetical protein
LSHDSALLAVFADADFALSHDFVLAVAAAADDLSQPAMLALAFFVLQQSLAATVAPETLAANAAVLITGDAPGATIADLIIDLWTLPAVVVLAPLAQHDAAAVVVAHSAFVVEAALAEAVVVADLLHSDFVADAVFVALSPHASESPAPTSAAATPNAATVASVIIFLVMSNAS